MKQFIFIYSLTLMGLYLLFYWDATPMANLINRSQVDLTSYLTTFTLPDETITDNKIWISSSLVLVIDKACNGLIPYFFFLASIIAFPSTLWHKIKWAVIGYVMLSLLNVLRIWFISQLVMLEESHFIIAHDFLGNLFLLLGGLSLFIGFIKTVPSDSKA